jgi:signal transduction histidine kinase
VIDALAPPGDGGIESTLGAIARRLAPCGIDVRIGGTWPATLPGPTRVAVARIVQEAVCNAIKHGGATEMTIDGVNGAEWLELSVRDNGTGFDTALATRRGGAIATPFGRGLSTMEARATELGGTFAVESKPGAGTQIVVMVPAFARTSQSVAS